MFRVVPADQRLDTEYQAAAQIDLRLVQQAQLLFVESVAQLFEQHQFFFHAGVHFACVKLEVVVAHVLGAVHGGVGVHHQRVRFFAVTRVHHHAHAARYLHFMASEQHRPRHRLANLFEQRRDRLRVFAEVGEEEDELIAAKTADRVIATYAVLHALADHLEQFVAGVVAEAVVDQLEAVEVDEGDRDAAVVALRLQDGLVEALADQAAVRQAGQVVVVGDVMNTLLGQFAFGDVAHDRHHAVFHRHHLAVHPQVAVKRGLAAPLGFVHAAEPNHFDQVVENAVVAVAGHQAQHAGADQILAAAAGQALGAAVGGFDGEVDDRAAGVADAAHDEERVNARFGSRGKRLLRTPAAALGALKLP